MNRDEKSGFVREGIAEVFVDESGDLGLGSCGNSRFLVLCATATTESEKLVRLVKRTRRILHLRGMGSPEFKFGTSSDLLRLRFVRGIADCDVRIAWVAAEKARVPARLMDVKGGLYEHMSAAVLKDILSHTPAKRLEVVFDWRNERWFRSASFDRAMETAILTSYVGNFPPSFRIRRVGSKNDPRLQVNDFVVGSVFQKVERNTERYYKVIAERVVSGRVLWREEVQPPDGVLHGAPFRSALYRPGLTCRIPNSRSSVNTLRIDVAIEEGCDL